MSHGPGAFSIRLLGERVPELAPSPDALFEAVRDASDRSRDSDELAAHIADWPTRRALSRLRSNVLLPLDIPQGARVLEVGCGSGALTRALAESGIAVTGLEPSMSEARTAEARTSGLGNVDIICGSLSEYAALVSSGDFDAVLLIGALARRDLGAARDPLEVLGLASELLRPGGTVVLATDNQLSLRHLLGYPDEHRGVPWIALEGYRSGRAARAWSRVGLSAMLDEAGLSEQRWLLPYPDHTLPTVIADARLYGSERGRSVLRQFVRTPVKDYASGSMLTADPVSAFHTMLDAGLGLETANSFLVVASGSGADPNSIVREGLLWLSSSERSAELMDRRELRDEDGALTLSPLREREEVRLPPLVAQRRTVPVAVGANLEDEIVAAASRASAPEDLRPLLQEWWAAAQSWLEEAFHVDLMPRNFIRSDDGALVYVDREWTWAEEAPPSWPMLRSLWLLAIDRLWPAGATAGLSWSLPLGDVVLALAGVIDPLITRSDLDRAARLESELQSRVLHRPADRELAELEELLQRPLITLSSQPALAQILERPLIAGEDAARIRQEAALAELAATDEVIGSRATIESLRRRVAELEAKVEWLQGRQVAAQLRKVRAVGGKVKRRVLG